MKNSELKQWQQNMDYTQTAAAKALGVSRATYCDMLRGIHRESGKPYVISRTVELACLALSAGLGDWNGELLARIK